MNFRRRGRLDWNLRSCGRQGHVTYRPDEPALAERLRADTAVGEAWRCLRCETFVPGPPIGSGPAEDAPIVLRGAELKDAAILRLLAVERFTRGLFLASVGYGILRFNGARDALHDVLQEYLPLLRPIGDKLGVRIEETTPIRLIERALAIHTGTVTLVGVGILAYAALQFTEAVGLWRLKRWGEYVAVVGTSAFLPLEIYELLEGFTWLKLVTIVINLAAVAYLLWSKHLFGIRGGHEAFQAARHSASVLEVERTASAAA
ncbi:MAG: DUF2127 domain-containing protein [Aeromicrobium sp.]